MYKLISSLILSILSFCCIAQTSQTIRYYKDHYLSKEVEKEKASYSKTITQAADTVTTEVKNIKTNTMFWSECYKGDEPIGIWINGTGTKDYDFTVVYSEDSCVFNFPGIVIKDFFSDVDSVGYVAPKIKNGQQSFYSFIKNNVIYPEPAKRKKLQGTSILFYTINAEGGIENIRVGKGLNISLDKEAIRVIRLLSFSSPAMLHGKPQSLCIKQRIKFALM